MGTRFNTLLRGSPVEVDLILQDTTLEESELRAALCNAFARIDRLEQRLENLTASLKTNEPTNAKNTR